MKFFTNHFRKVHFFILAGFIIIFSALTFWVMIDQTPGDWRDNNNYTATLLAASGPFTGAIARWSPSAGWHGWEFSVKLFPYCLAFLVAGIFFQFVVLPFRRGAMSLRMVVWIIGLLGWFAGTVLSLGYAMG